jgi:hypothetical protein
VKVKVREMNIISLPDSIFHIIVDFIDINSLIDSCKELSVRLKNELYCIYLNHGQSIAYFHAHCRHSYVLCPMTGIYYLSTFAMEPHYQKQCDKSGTRLNLNKDQLLFYQRIHRVKINISYYRADYEDVKLLFFSYIGIYITHLSVDIDFHMDDNVMEYTDKLTRLTSLDIQYEYYLYNGKNILDVRDITSLRHITVRPYCKGFPPKTTLKIYSTDLQSITTYKAEIAVHRQKVKNLYIHEMRYLSALPNKKSALPFTNIYYYTDKLLVDDFHKFHSATHVILHGRPRDAKVMIRIEKMSILNES